MGLFSNAANKAMKYIEEDTIRMKSSQGALECQIMLEEASDTSFLDIIRAFVRMCNKGQEPEIYFWRALDIEIREKPIKVQKQAVEILRNIDRPEGYKSLIRDLENYIKIKESHEESHKPEQIRMYRAKVQEMSTNRLQNEISNAKSDIQKDAYLIELKQREKYRRKAKNLSVEDLKSQCRNMQKGSEKVVYQEEIARRNKVTQKLLLKLQEDYIDRTERKEKLTDLFECDVISKEEYQSIMKEWSEEVREIEKKRSEEEEKETKKKLIADLEKDIPDVIERIKKISELYENKVISETEYKVKKEEWLKILLKE